MKKMNGGNRKFWGIVLIVIGAAFLLDRSGLLDINLFFAGWWTLFLIVPALYMMVKSGIQTGNVVLLGVGVYFLLDEQGVRLGWIVLPAVLILLGIAMIFRKR